MFFIVLLQGFLITYIAKLNYRTHRWGSYLMSNITSYITKKKKIFFCHQINISFGYIKDNFRLDNEVLFLCM